MAHTTDTATRVSLLLRVQDVGDQEAWRAFVHRYGPQILGWCRRHGLQDSDAADVTQEVLGKLVRAMQTFQYTPERGSFRGWLKTVTANAVKDLARRWKAEPRALGDSGALETLSATSDAGALAELTAAIESEYEQELLAEAERRVRLRVRPHTWLAYQRTAVENHSSRDAAAELGIRVTDVYVAKSRIIKMLREEVQLIEQASTTPGPESRRVDDDRSQPPPGRIALAPHFERRRFPEACGET